MTLGLCFSMSIHWQLNSQCQAYITSGTNVCSIKQTGAEVESAMNRSREGLFSPGAGEAAESAGAVER